MANLAERRGIYACPMNTRRALIATLPLFLLAPNATSQEVYRPRARDLGVEVGILPPGPWNAITDVEGVWVGKLLGVTQVRELGELETPILLTCTLCVFKVADALVGWALEQEGMEPVSSQAGAPGQPSRHGTRPPRFLRQWPVGAF